MFEGILFTLEHVKRKPFIRRGTKVGFFLAFMPINPRKAFSSLWIQILKELSTQNVCSAFSSELWVQGVTENFHTVYVWRIFCPESRCLPFLDWSLAVDFALKDSTCCPEVGTRWSASCVTLDRPLTFSSLSEGHWTGGTWRSLTFIYSVNMKCSKPWDYISEWDT